MSRFCIVYLVTALAVLGNLLPSNTWADDFTTLYKDAATARESGNYPKAEEKLRLALELSPDSVDVLLYLGMVQAYQKKYTPALEAIEKALILSPENLDLKIMSARIKGWAGELDEARREADKILLLASENIEANILVARLAYYAGDMDAAEDGFQKALKIDPTSSSAREGLDSIVQSRLAVSQDTPLPPELVQLAMSPQLRPQWRLDTGYSTSRFNSGDRPDWHEGFVNLSRKSGDSTFATRIERARRFGLDDTYIRLGLDHRFTDNATGYVRIGGTSSADFLARWTFETGGSLRLWDGNGWVGPTVLTIDMKQKDYTTGDVRNADPGLKQYLFNDRLWLTFKKIHTRDVAAGKTHPGWSGKIDLQVMDDLRLFMGFSDTGESEQGATAVTKSRFFGLVSDITPDFGFNLSYTRDDRETVYIRKVYAAGVTIKF